MRLLMLALTWKTEHMEAALGGKRINIRAKLPTTTMKGRNHAAVVPAPEVKCEFGRWAWDAAARVVCL